MTTTPSPREHADAAFAQAQKAARHGDLAASERWTKTAERLIAAAERLAKLSPPETPAEAVEAEVSMWVASVRRFLDDELGFRLWQFEATVHRLYGERAAAEGLPPAPPLRAPPFADEEEFLERFGPGDELLLSLMQRLAHAIERDTIARLKVLERRA